MRPELVRYTILLATAPQIVSEPLNLSSTVGEDQVIAAFTTRIYEVPQARVCSVEWVGGEQMELWADQAVEIIEDYGRAAGCNKVEGHGRMGWSKLMKKHDWKFLAISHEKDIQ